MKFLKGIFVFIVVLFLIPLILPMIKKSYESATGQGSSAGGNEVPADFIEKNILYPLGKIINDVAVEPAKNVWNNTFGVDTSSTSPYLYNSTLGLKAYSDSNLNKFTPIK